MSGEAEGLSVRLRKLAAQIDPCLVGGRDALLLREAAERIETLESWADGPNGVKWYTDRHAEQAARVEQLEAAVKLAATWFDEYAMLHRAKGTAEGNDKGQRNQDRADQLRAVLAA